MANLQQYDGYINAAAQKWGVEPGDIRAIIMQESGGDPNARAKGSTATGLGQFTIGTATDLGYKPEDRLDPEKAIDMIANYHSKNLKRFGGSKAKALYAYNQGPGAAEKAFSGSGSPNAAGLKYMNSANFKGIVDPNEIANPVAQLPTARAPLKGGALLTAKPDASEESANEAGTVATAGQTQDYQQQFQLQNAQLLEDARKRQKEQDKKAEQEQRNKLYQDTAFALAGALGHMFSPKEQVTTTSGEGAGRSAGYEYSTPTQQALQSFNSFGSYK